MHGWSAKSSLGVFTSFTQAMPSSRLKSTARAALAVSLPLSLDLVEKADAVQNSLRLSTID